MPLDPETRLPSGIQAASGDDPAFPRLVIPRYEAFTAWCLNWRKTGCISSKSAAIAGSF